MPGWASTYPVVGSQPASIVVPTTDQKHPLGQRLVAHDTQGAFGGGTFMYGKAAAAIVNTGRLVYPDFDGTMVDIPNTAGTASPVAVAMGPMAINTFGWFQLSGLLVVQTAASVAAGTVVGVGGAGQAGANTAGKQLQGARVVKASTYAVTKAGRSNNASKQVNVSDTGWLFPGVVVSGTGIPVGAVITAIDPSGTSFLLDQVTTAAVNSTLTFTYTGYLLLSAPNGIATQGAIT